MPMKVLMDWSIPLPCILFKIGGIPEILIELPISESSQLRIEISDEIENEEEHREIETHDWQIPAWIEQVGVINFTADLIK